MNDNAHLLYPLVDPTGLPLQGLGGEPLAADDQGIVYTLRGTDQPPMVMGQLAPAEDGRLVLVPLNGLGATPGEKSARIQAARCRRAMARRRRQHLEQRILHLTQRIERGQAAGTLAPRDQTRLERERQEATTKLEQAKAREASAQKAVDEANSLSLSGMGDQEDMAGSDDEMAGLGRFRHRFSRGFMKRAALMAMTGGAAAPLVMASHIPGAQRTMPGRLLSGEETPVATQMAGLGASWWTRNRDKVVGFGAGAATAALAASAASPGSGLNTLVTQGWDAAKGFFLPGQAAPAAPAAAPGPAPAPMPMMMPMARGAPGPVPMVQAGMGGMDGKTLLLLGGLGLGALVLLRPKT